jgi:hypothetical protein
MEARISNPTILVPDAAAIPRLRSIAYWVISAPVLLETMVGAQWDLVQTPYVRETMVHLG